MAVVDDSVFWTSILIGFLVFLVIIGLLGGKWNIFYLLKTFFENVVSDRQYVAKEGADKPECVLEARVGKWEIYLPDERMEWTEEIFYLRSEDINENIGELLTPYAPFSARLFKEYYTAIITQGKACEIKLKCLDPNTGIESWKKKKSYPVKDEQGEVIGIRGFLRRALVR